MSRPDATLAAIVSATVASIGAVATIAGAVPYIDKRLGRLRDVAREVGKLPRPVTLLYDYPQRIYKWGLILIAFAGLFVVLPAFLFEAIYPDARSPWIDFAQRYGLVLVGLWGVL